MEEEWKAIPGANGYYVSDQGRVRSHYKQVGPPHHWIITDEPQRIIAPGRERNGYLNVGIKMNGGKITQKIHHLVMLSFIGPKQDGIEVCHIDNNPANNRLSNLRYDTHANNMKDMMKPERLRKRYNKFVSDKMAEKEVVSRIEPLLYDEVERIANESDTTISAVVREAIRQFIASHQAAVEKAWCA